MRKLIAWAFMYSLDGLLADDGTDYWQYCFGLPADPAETRQKVDVYQSAYAHIMGRTAYEAMADAMTADHPFTPILNPARKVVFSRTLKTAEWANTVIAAGDTMEEIDKLRRGGDRHIVVWGGVSLWRSLMQLDLIDEFRLDLHPYVAGEGTRLFNEAAPQELPARPGLQHRVQQRDRRAALPPAPLSPRPTDHTLRDVP